MNAHTPQQFSYQAAIWRAVELSIAYPEGFDCRKYNIPLYTASPNIPDTYAATPGRAASLPGNAARPAAAGHALTQIMSQYATGREYSIPAYESTVSEDNDVDRGRGVATDGGVSIAPACAHLRTRRYGRTNSEGEPIVEVRCMDCGRTLSTGGVGR